MRSRWQSLCRWPRVALPADAQWLNHPTPNIPRTSDGKPDLAAPAPRGADGHPDLSGPWTGRSAVFRVPDEALTEQSKALIHEREENYFKDRPVFPVSAQRARDGGRLEAHHPDAVTHRDRVRDPHLPLHFHGRPHARSQSRTHVDGVLRRTMGRRHAGRRQLRIQRSHVVGRSRHAPHGSAPDDRTLPCGARSDSCRSSSP